MCEHCRSPLKFTEDGFLVYHTNGCPPTPNGRDAHFGICEHCDAPLEFTEQGFLIYHADGCPPKPTARKTLAGPVEELMGEHCITFDLDIETSKPPRFRKPLLNRFERPSARLLRISAGRPARWHNNDFHDLSDDELQRPGFHGGAMQLKTALVCTIRATTSFSTCSALAAWRAAYPSTLATSADGTVASSSLAAIRFDSPMSTRWRISSAMVRAKLSRRSPK